MMVQGVPRVEVDGIVVQGGKGGPVVGWTSRIEISLSPHAIEAVGPPLVGSLPIDYPL